jgi:mRNA interferase MazF
MVTPTAGAVVLVPFPFSDLSQAKLRPAIALADAGRGDWILCQVTSKPYADPKAVKLTDLDLISGSLQVVSYARPGKLFTANHNLMVAQVAILGSEPFKKVIKVTVEILHAGLKREGVKAQRP